METIDLSLGDVNSCSTPECLTAEMERCSKMRTQKSPPGGDPELKDLFVADFHRRTGVKLDPALMTTFASGSGTVLASQFEFVRRKRRSLFLWAPFWFGYRQLCQRVGTSALYSQRLKRFGKSRGIGTLEEALEVDRRIGAIVINQFGTPDGSSFSAGELRRIADRALDEKRPLYVIEDCLCYSVAFPGRRFLSIAEVAPELNERGLLLGSTSFTKGWSVDDENVGIAWGPKEFIDYAEKRRRREDVAPSLNEEIALRSAFSSDGLAGPENVSRTAARNVRALKELCESTRFRLARVPSGGVNVLLDYSNFYTDSTEPPLGAFEYALLYRERLELYPGYHFHSLPMQARLNLVGARNEAQFDEAMWRLRDFDAMVN